MKASFNHTNKQAAFVLDWQARYTRRASVVADALAQFAAGEGSHDRAGDAEIIAGGVLFLSSYLNRIADEAESNAATFKKGPAQ